MRYLVSRRFEMGLIVVGLGVACYFASRPVLEGKWKSSCQSNLKQIGLATFQYTRDYDEQWMLAPNWKAALKPYGLRGSSDVIFCPKSARDYAYNINFSASYMEVIDKPDNIALYYEPANDVNADGGNNWATSGIHGEGSNVCFADGHVKWLSTKPTFWTAEFNNKAKIAAKHAAWWRNFLAQQKKKQNVKPTQAKP